MKAVNLFLISTKKQNSSIYILLLNSLQLTIQVWYEEGSEVPPCKPCQFQSNSPITRIPLQFLKIPHTPPY